MSTRDRLETYRSLYAGLKPGWRHATSCYQAWIVERLQPGSRVLDLGCGRGGVVERLGNAGRWTGMDPDVDSLLTHRVTSLPRAAAQAERLPFAAGAFDLVAASWVLEHLPDPAAVFAEVARVLAPGGHFIFLTPNRAHPIPRLSCWLARRQVLQRQTVHRWYARAQTDTFQVYYRANTLADIGRCAAQARLDLRRIELIDDPSYFARNPFTFSWAIALELAFPPLWKVHFVGEMRKA